MTEEQKTPEDAAIAVAPSRAPVTFDADDPVALYMDATVFDQLQRVAKLMAASALVPEHLRGAQKVSDCFLVAAQAFRWRTDPFAVAQHTFVLRGKLGYEGKLIAAVVNSHRRMETRLSYRYSGESRSRKVVVSAKIKGESEAREVEGTVERWATDNEQWKKDPDQMLAYRGARQWARRHMPEAMIGIQADEELREAIDVAPGPEPPKSLGELTQKLAEIAAPKPTAPEPQETTQRAEPEPSPDAPKQSPATGSGREPGEDDDDDAPSSAAPTPCDHPTCPPGRVKALLRGQTATCEDCGKVFHGELEPSQEPAPRGRRSGQGRLV